MPTIMTDVLGPFEPLLGLGADWQDEAALSRVRDAKQRIQLAQGEQTETIHHTVRTEFPTIVEQYRNALDVQQRLGTTSAAIEDLQRGMHDAESLTAPLIELLQTRSSLRTQHHTSSRQLATLLALQSHLEKLQHAETQLHAGHAEVSGVLALLRPLEKGETDLGVLPRCKVFPVLEGRAAMVKQAATAQLQEAFERAFNVDASPIAPSLGRTAEKGVRQGDDGWGLDEDLGVEEPMEKVLVRMTLANEVPLRVVTLDQSSKPSQTLHAHLVPIPTLLDSLHSLALLQPLLTALHTRTIKHIVRPLVESYAPANAGPFSVRYTRSGEGERGVIELYEGLEKGQEGLWDGLQLVFKVMHDALPRSPTQTAELNAETGTKRDNFTGSIASFFRHLASETLHIVLDAFLLPSLPLPSGTPEGEEDVTASLDSLHHWVNILHRAQEFETTLFATHVTPSSTHPHHRSVIREFVETRAGTVYASSRKRNTLNLARDLVLPTDTAAATRQYRGGWAGWQSQVVVRERIVGPPLETGSSGQAGSEKVEEVSRVESTSKGGSSSTQEGEEGWGFDDVSDATLDKADGAPELMVEGEKKSGEGTDEADGWGFDEEDSIRDHEHTPKKVNPSPPSSTPTEIIAPKPIRQARKIGKKGKASGYTTEAAVASSNGGSNEATPLVGSPSLEDSASGPIGSPAFGAAGASLQKDSGAAGETVPLPAQSSTGDKDGDGWNMDWEAESQMVPNPTATGPQRARIEQTPTVVRERMRVSIALEQVVQIIRTELTFIGTLQKNEISLPSFQFLAESLATIPSETLELVRALVPVLYESQIRDVPALAVQFANDCSWLSERVRQVLGQMMGEGVAVDGLGKQLDKLVSLSTIVFDKQMDAQLDAIMDTLFELGGLETTSDDRKFQACTRAFQDVEHKLETLFRVYGDVMPESTCLESMGRLIDNAISQICTDILAVVDITAEESERLKQLCQILRPIEERFNEMNVNIVAFVPHWLRFCYLSEIMEASLVDITYLLESGALVDFTSDELVHLLLALFTDTPNRAELINKVMSRTQT